MTLALELERAQDRWEAAGIRVEHIRPTADSLMERGLELARVVRDVSDLLDLARLERIERGRLR